MKISHFLETDPPLETDLWFEEIEHSYVSLGNMKNPFEERWKKLEKRFQQVSRFGDYQTFKLRPYIVKANDDLR